jgi:outer membrane protein OmpA-like peptidoglycan-associated protein
MSDVLFATGKAELRAGATSGFDRFADALKNQPGHRITIEGHTDSVGGEESNIALSQRRADAVKNYLVRRGVPADSITTTGKGEAFPVAGNETSAGRQKNRRVEVIIDNIPTAASTSSN